MKNQTRIMTLLGAFIAQTFAAGMTKLPAGEPPAPAEVRRAVFEEPVATTGSTPIDEVLAEPGSGRGILHVTAGRRKVQEGLIKARVEKELSSARNEMGTNPDGAEQNLKELAELLKLANALSAETRNQLLSQVQDAMRAARRQASVVKEKIAREKEKE